MAAVRLSPVAIEDLEQLIDSHGLPDDAKGRVRRSLRALERFPRIGRELEGRWAGLRFIIGPWPWMLIVYEYDPAGDDVSVIAVHDGRSSSSATARRVNPQA